MEEWWCQLEMLLFTWQIIMYLSRVHRFRGGSGYPAPFSFTVDWFEVFTFDVVDSFNFECYGAGNYELKLQVGDGDHFTFTSPHRTTIAPPHRRTTAPLTTTNPAPFRSPRSTRSSWRRLC